MSGDFEQRDRTDERRRRAVERRRRASIRKTTLAAGERDLSPLRGPRAIALVAELSRESSAMSGRPFPDYARVDTPYRFVPWPGE